MYRSSAPAQYDDDDDSGPNQQYGGQQYGQQQYDDQQDDDEQYGQQQDDDDDDQQRAVYSATQSDDEAQQEAGEEAIDPSIKVTPIRTNSDPLPSQSAERDRVDKDYHPDIVMLPDDDEETDSDAEIKFNATLDSGCEDNWISLAKMQEHDLALDKIQPLSDSPGEQSSDFTDFNGGDVAPTGQVQLRFRASGSGRSEEALFYVVDNDEAPFDALFGRTFMDEHDGGPNFFKKPVLINAGKPLSTAEKTRKDAGVRGTSAFAAPEPATNNFVAQDEPAPAEQHTGIGKWGKKLAGGFSKLGH